MNKKQGITITMLTITIIILIILAGTITYSIYSTINYSNISTWVSEISYIQDTASEKLKESTVANFVGDSIYIDLTNVGTQEIAEQFEGETISENKVVVQILDLEKLNVTNTMYGKLSTDKDVYAMSQQTGRVYYVQGIELNNSTYFTATTSLKEKYNIQSTNNNLTTVVFVPSKTGYTKEAISVTVKVPNTYTNIAITTTNSNISIGSRVVEEKTYEYLVNSNNIVGNYTITVSYNTGVQTLVSEYEVNSYDEIAPVINELTDENFIYKKTETDTIFYAINITATDNLGIKVLKYDLGEITLEDAASHFQDNGSVIYDGKINLDRTNEIYTIYAEDYAGNYSVLTFDRYDYVVITEAPPAKWSENIYAIVNGVPIPKGFAASPYNGENKISEGFVIYELTSTEIENKKNKLPEDETQFKSKTERNQYVWVPVNKHAFSTEFVRKVELNNLAGVLNDNGEYYSLGASGSTWEVEVDNTTNIPLSKENTSDYKLDSTLNFTTDETLIEAQTMYASIEEYGGFYIGRYEVGVDIKNRKTSDDGELVNLIHSKMNKAPYTYIRFTYNRKLNEDTNGAVSLARNMYLKDDNNYGVMSNLTYGVQRDRVLSWWLETKAQNGTKDVTISSVDDLKNSTYYGNYRGNEIPNATFNEQASVSTDRGIEYTTIDTTYSKKPGDSHMFTTGATEEAKVNNIYDLGGNVWEWTMEGYSDYARISCGGGFSGYGVTHPVIYRGIIYPDYSDDATGFRISLYIKLPT